ncbi:hypothetical protein Mapa_010444 [Marchantia paleacea]|nr:hypothetical protein Mapa_010444 [Marchantia paleacea]
MAHHGRAPNHALDSSTALLRTWAMIVRRPRPSSLYLFPSPVPRFLPGKRHLFFLLIL